MNRTLDQVLVSIAAICLLVAMRHVLGPQVVLVAAIMLVLGFAIAFYGDKLLNGFLGRFKAILTKTAGIILMVGGANLLLERVTAEYWWVLGIAALVLYNTHHLISEKFR